jgi:hypothetical protein
LVKADTEQNESLAKLQKPHAWAVSKKKMNAITKVERAEKASKMFNVRVAPQKLCKLIGQGPLQIILSA